MLGRGVPRTVKGKPENRRMLGSGGWLDQPLDPPRHRNAYGQVEDLLGHLGHARQQAAPAREDDTRVELTLEARAQGKCGKSRYVPVHRSTVRVLRAYRLERSSRTPCSGARSTTR